MSGHSDVFPLPVPSRPGFAAHLAAALGSATTSQLRRVSAACSSLNGISAATVGSTISHARHPRQSTSASNLQRRCLDGILRRVRSAGEPPAELTEREAFSALLAATGLYCLEPQNVATYDVDKLRVANGDVVPKRAVGLLPSREAAYIRRHDLFIEKSAAAVLSLEAGDSLPQPYWDPVLAADFSSRREFLKMLSRV